MSGDWIHKLDDEGSTPLARASISGRNEITNLMLTQEANDQPRYMHELPEIHRAACWGFDEVVLELIRTDHDPNEMDVQGETPLHKAVRMGHFDVARVLLDHDAACDRVAPHRS